MKQQARQEGYHQQGLYNPQFEHDACGIGVVVDIKGCQSHETVDDALKIVEKLEHRAGKDAQGKTGDGLRLGQCPSAPFPKRLTSVWLSP